MSIDPIRVSVHPALREIAPDFLQRARTRVVEMRTALAAQDTAQLARTAHQLGGAGSSFGMPPVTEWSRAIERAATSGDLATVTTTLEALDDYLSRVEFQ